MTQKISEPHLSAWRNLITFHAGAIDAIDRALIAAKCIPLHWYDVLIELFEADEQRLRMHELANKVVLSRSGLTRLVDRLEDASLITRQPDPQDRRGFYAELTEAGTQALRDAWPVYAGAITENFAKYLSEEEANILASAFARMLKGSKS